MWIYLKNRSVHKVLLLLLVDLLLLTLAIYGGYVIKFSARTMKFSLDLAFHRANLFLIIAVFSHILSIYAFGLYSVVRPSTPIRLFLSTAFSILLSTAFLMALQFFVPGYWIGRVVLAIQIPLCIAGIYGWRMIFYSSPLSWTHRKRLALIGSASLLSEFLREAGPPLSFRYRIHGLLVTGEEGPPSSLPPEPGVRRYESVADLLADARTEAVAFQFMDPRLSEADTQALLHRSCEGLEMSDLTTLYKGMTGKVPLPYVSERWLLSYLGIQGGPSPFYLQVKRIMDVAAGLAGMLIFLPLMLCIGIWVRLDSRGPALFRQERLGQYRRGFQCLKFRTMVERAEQQTGPVWSAPDDPRITRAGRWLRRLRLDELPQLINVVRGDMSLIGPRPIRAHFADQLARRVALYELRFALRPGLTGWAQVNHPYADSQASQTEKFEYELFYIQNASVFLDCMILMMTIRTVFTRKGQ